MKIRLRRLATTLALSLATLASAAQAQVARQGATVRQGSPDPAHVFHSPMIIEVPLPDISHISPGQGLTISSDLSQYICDDTSLGKLTVEVKKPRRTETGKQILEFPGTVHVAKSRDRLVDVSMAVKQGNLVLATASATNLDVEEEATGSFRIRLAIDELTLHQALASDQHPTLEITLVVRDNT
jgi:hypothetical protein